MNGPAERGVAITPIGDGTGDGLCVHMLNTEALMYAYLDGHQVLVFRNGRDAEAVADAILRWRDNRRKSPKKNGGQPERTVEKEDR